MSRSKKTWQSPHLLENEMNRLHMRHRLEPNLTVEEGESAALLSFAISMKRWVDLCETKTPSQRLKDAHIAMVNSLIGHHLMEGIGLSELMKMVEDYFYKHIGLRLDEQ